MRSKIVLAAALIMGLATTALFFTYMRDLDQKAASVKETVRVLAAKQAIAENTKLTGAMLELVDVPATAINATALREAGLAAGKITAARLVPGEVLLPHHLKDQQEEALFVSKKIREGYRAAAVGVNLVQSVSNLIEPGDYVDVVYTAEDKATKKMTSTMILENVRVLAIGRRMIEALTDTPYVEYATVTLEVKPADGVKLIRSDEEGTVSLMLRSRVAVAAGAKGAAGAAAQTDKAAMTKK
ncbi:pilus assembly protein CpaB [Paenibacillus phyllosphaerae]|uniref:Pilus assembly protein CpaB n=1 Tax=Paenibacillus phyllosphaerae TaxID=274593 RepID=A0A7W5B3M6_9BACL|nr:Flp pilus assembly protein CpaB [Paenibacillus phyllosphaerae]MBB3113825.1 pilus assembly protein CpaB [Paenibacillus phyllosphaerae]